MEVFILMMILMFICILFVSLLPYLRPLWIILFLYSLYRNYKVRKQMQKHFGQQYYQDESHEQSGQSRSQNNSNDVIDVEYSEETIDDEK